MRRIKAALFIGFLLLILDIYVFFVLKTVLQSIKFKTVVYSIYWIISGICIITLFTLPASNYEKWNPQVRTFLFAFIFIIFLSKFVAAAIFLIDDIRRLFTYIFRRLFASNTTYDNISEVENKIQISRSTFLNWLGLGLGGTLMSTLFYGFTNRYNYKVHKETITFPDLPNAFDGLKIVQLSDIHSGSFTNKQAVLKGIQKANELNPDIILFTGDIVNDRATELVPYKELFAQLKAPLGVYSVLGNHDYGDYVGWDTPMEKQLNLQTLKQHHADMGWKLLLNENVKITRQNAVVTLIGIENWGSGTFAKYGKLQDAYTGIQPNDFQILMSHDPSHWDEEVIPSYKHINLALAGHTHGAQFGVEIPGIKWSPISWRYKQWAGLYKKENQYLYVNRGFGFLGYPGRVGILPEITLLTLKKG
jgi:uncharacterized protein